MPVSPLIESLVKDLKPVRRRTARADALIVAALCLLELALFLRLGMAQPDMKMAMHQPTFWWRLASLFLIAVLGAATAIASFDPVASPRRGLRRLALAVAACLAAGLFIRQGSFDAASLAARLDWHDGIQCVAKMVSLSIPPLAGLGLLMRRGAPTDRAGTSLAVGITAAAWGAFVFVFACPYNDPLYIAVWYTVGCGLVTILARLLLPRLVRW
ncbi:MAG TPA: DUF1109 domain-containing protein [Acetobacteraceae bacterium]|nr:DUF1109 domain-containing protein [Acetobacteraceae bacterium]